MVNECILSNSGVSLYVGGVVILIFLLEFVGVLHSQPSLPLWIQTGQHAVEHVEILLQPVLMHHSRLLQQILIDLRSSHCSVNVLKPSKFSHYVYIWQYINDLCCYSVTMPLERQKVHLMTLICIVDEAWNSTTPTRTTSSSYSRMY